MGSGETLLCVVQPWLHVYVAVLSTYMQIPLHMVCAASHVYVDRHT